MLDVSKIEKKDTCLYCHNYISSENEMIFGWDGCYSSNVLTIVNNKAGKTGQIFLAELIRANALYKSATSHLLPYKYMCIYILCI